MIWLFPEMQFRYPTELSAEDYVRTEAWEFIVVVRCPIHPDSDCRITRHGTYPRKIPDGAKILRILCHTDNITFSLLPDCFSSRLSGTLADMESIVLMVETVVRNSGWLEDAGVVEKPGCAKPVLLPDVFERYVERFRKTRSVKDSRIIQIRKELGGFHDWLKDRRFRLCDLKIGQVDDFLRFRTRDLAPSTCSDVRGILKGFLRYLRLEEKMIRRNLSSMIVAAPVFAYENPPRYLRKSEIRNLFATADLGTNEGLRAHAMTRLAYTTGLRPSEIARIRMGDVSFEKRELTVPERKGNNPVRFPLPEETVKAIAAYVIGVRPENTGRNLFVSLSPPHNPVTGFLSHDEALSVFDSVDLKRKQGFRDYTILHPRVLR